jgi:hypothetical protein
MKKTILALCRAVIFRFTKQSEWRKYTTSFISELKDVRFYIVILSEEEKR